MTKAIFCLATSDEQARRIVDRLLSAGFSNEDISVLYPNQNRDRVTPNARDDVAYNERDDVAYDDSFNQRNVKKSGFKTEKNTKAPEGAVTGATAGGILGGSLGLLAGIGALAIPGIGPFIAAGPIMAALSGSAVGGSLGLLIGAIVGSGIPEYEAKKYETALREGNILISFHSDDFEALNRANGIMKKEGARDISMSRETTRSR